MRANAQVVAFLQADDGIIGFAQLAGALDNGLEHRPNIGWRGCNHTEYVGAPGLISQRLREVARLRLHFVEQPYVLDCDHGLVGKGLEQGDVLVAENL